MAMNNSHLAERFGIEGMSGTDAGKLFDGAFDAIVTAATSGNEVSISGFGKFEIKESIAREGRNPARAETVQIAASNKLGSRRQGLRRTG